MNANQSHKWIRLRERADPAAMPADAQAEPMPLSFLPVAIVSDAVSVRAGVIDTASHADASVGTPAQLREARTRMHGTGPCARECDPRRLGSAMMLRLDADLRVYRKRLAIPS